MTATQYATQLVSWRTATSNVVPANAGDASTLSLGTHQPEMIALMGEGWEPLSHTILPISPEELLISVLLKRPLPEVPDELPSDLV